MQENIRKFVESAEHPILAVPLFLRQGWETTKASPSLYLPLAGCPILAVPLFLRQGWETTKASPSLYLPLALPQPSPKRRKKCQKRAKTHRQPPPISNLINNIRGIFRKKHPSPPFSAKNGPKPHPGHPLTLSTREG